MNYFSYLCKLRNVSGTMEEKKVNIGKRPVRIFLMAAGIWLALLIILQIALSPSVLTPAINRTAAEYIDGEVSFGKVRISMFRHFPNIGLLMEDCSVTYPAERFDSLEQKGAQGMLLTHGTGEVSDTLASFDRLSVSINVAALLTGKVRIPHVMLAKPRIFAHSYDEENANWNIIRTSPSEKDTTVKALPHISIGRIMLLNHPHIVYTDSRDTLFAIADMKKMIFRGRLDSRRTSRIKVGLTLDSLLVAGRIASDTLGMKLDRLYIHEHGKHLDIEARANAMLATSAFGRTNIPVSIEGTAAFGRDSMLTASFHGFKAEIASIPMDFDADICRKDGQTSIKGRFGVEGCKADDLISDFVSRIIPETKDIRTDALINIKGNCEGHIGGGRMPVMEVNLNIPESSVRHKDFEHDIRFTLDAGMKTDTSGKADIGIETIKLDTYGLHLHAKGGLADLTGDDPAISIEGRLEVSADSLSAIIPKDYGLTAEGDMSAALSGTIRKSQINIYNFAEADIKGHLKSRNLIVKSPKDTIDIEIKGLEINASPETVTSKIRKNESFRLLGITGSISDAGISYKEAISLKGKEISISAKNSADAFSDTTRVYPLGGRLNAVELEVKDASGMSVTLDQTGNSFQMVPKKDHKEIPVLSLSSTNKRIYVRDAANRLILTDAGLKVRAAMNTFERRQRFKAMIDSLSRIYPDTPKDSLMHRMRRERGQEAVEDWMTEEDFKAADLNLSLDGMLASYFRRWDISGGIDVRTGIVMTPYLPLRNILKGMSISFNNDEIKINDFKIISGESEIAASGALTGLRRALLGRGRYKLDMNLSTEKMDAGELLAAYDAGASFDPEADTDRMTGASDSEFLKLVVADTLERDETTSLIVVPSDIEATLHLNARNITFTDLIVEDFRAEMTMKERCLQILEAEARTNMGQAAFDGFYATRTKKDIRTGFNFSLTDITSEKVIGMMPAIDTVMPLLKSFKGLIDCDMAATASLDTNMNIITPSINGVIRISGEDLTMSDSEVFSSLARKLKFKNSKEAAIDRMTVEGLMKDNVLEIFPFILELDRYTLALSGLQYMDMSYRYHASIIRSPIVFKVGVDIYGPDFGHMKFKIGKPKYRNTSIPVFAAEIDQTRINLAESIKNIFEKGVDMAIRENERQEVITDHKTKIGYVNAADQHLEELSEEELQKLDEAEEPETQKDTSRYEQSGIH